MLSEFQALRLSFSRSPARPRSPSCSPTLLPCAASRTLIAFRTSDSVLSVLCRAAAYLSEAFICPVVCPTCENNFRSDTFSRTRIMIKLFKVKEKQREIAENANGRAPVKKQTAGELRLHKDISELNLPKTTTITFPKGKDDLMNFEVTIRPDEGYFLWGTFVFTFHVPSIYPHEAPKVKCKTKVYHPNIDLEGNVCLNILREDWKPVLNINTIIYGLNHLFTQPNHEDPLNSDAAAVLRDNPKMFEANVRRAMAGGYVGQTFFPRCV